MTYENLAQRVNELGNKTYEAINRYIRLGRNPTFVEQAQAKLRQRCFVELPALFEPYRQLPDPADFTNMINYLRDGLRQLCVGQDTRDPISAQGDIYLANGALDELPAAASLIQAWTGNAATEFKKQYIDHFPSLVHNQFILVSALKAALEAEQAHWARARVDVTNLVEAGINAVDALDDCTPKEWAVAFTALAALTGVILAIPTGGSSLAVAAEITISVIGAAAWVTAALPPAGGPTITISGNNGYAILDSMQSAVQTMTIGLNQQEEEIAASIRRLTGTFRSHPDSFVARRPALAGATAATITSPQFMGRPGYAG